MWYMDKLSKFKFAAILESDVTIYRWAVLCLIWLWLIIFSYSNFFYTVCFYLLCTPVCNANANARLTKSHYHLKIILFFSETIYSCGRKEKEKPSDEHNLIYIFINKQGKSFSNILKLSHEIANLWSNLDIL